MSLQEFEDCNREKICLWVQDGYKFPKVMASKPYHLKELQSWETREDDILVCTYPKSGKYIVNTYRGMFSYVKYTYIIFPSDIGYDIVSSLMGTSVPKLSSVRVGDESSFTF